ncbi:hypothetical protein TrVE_jg7102 [Triparma verrucosa]|uniref:Uncharacterized protein n=1 Tax=Triparma verrucosa TaxID=1606542 RepID=A0A9W7FDL0_9STRA|nr:hypothetical protein TrVE_jg7102 [Triparma verrucosa]
MSKRSEDAIAILDPNSLEAGDDDTEVFEGSEVNDHETQARGGDDFMHTDDFRRLFVEFVMVDTLVTMRWLDRKWHKVVEKKLTEVGDGPYGGLIVHGGTDVSPDEAHSDARKEKTKQVTKVAFLLNVTKVGERACFKASILLTVDIPEGITFIGDRSFFCCHSLTTVSFPKSLALIDEWSFSDCFSLEKVNLLHTNVREVGYRAFGYCTSLREMKIPNSLQTFGKYVFSHCSELVPAGMDVTDNDAVVGYLRSIQ